MKSKSHLDRTVQLAFGSAILALLVVGAISYRSLAASRESNRWVKHTHEVLANLGNLLFAMESAESNCRGFVLTGSESYLESYHANLLGVERYRLKVANLTLDNSSQQRRLSDLKRLADEKIQFSESVIRLRQTGGLSYAADAIKNGPGQGIMQDFQAAVFGMQDEEKRLLVLRDADATQRISQTKTILIVGTVLGLLIVTAAGWNVRRDHSARAIAEDALREGEGRFSTLANSMSQLAWMADGKGYIFWYNDRWFEYTGTTLGEMEGWGWIKVHHPDHVQRVVKKISACFESGEDWKIPFLFAAKMEIIAYFSPRPSQYAIRQERCCAGSAQILTSVRAKSRAPSIGGCWKRLPMRWSWSIRTARLCC